MIYLYGDSHAQHSFAKLAQPHQNLSQPSVTMFRVGRDKVIPNFDPNSHDEQSVVCFAYGEVDCRCPVQRQVDLGRGEDEVIHELVQAYVEALRSCMGQRRLAVVVAVIPPTRRAAYEAVHGPIRHEFPFVGSDQDRVRYTEKMNRAMQTLCEDSEFLFFDPYTQYTDLSGHLPHELSDGQVHVADSLQAVHEFNQLLAER